MSRFGTVAWSRTTSSPFPTRRTLLVRKARTGSDQLAADAAKAGRTLLRPPDVAPAAGHREARPCRYPSFVLADQYSKKSILREPDLLRLLQSKRSHVRLHGPASNYLAATASGSSTLREGRKHGGEAKLARSGALGKGATSPLHTHKPAEKNLTHSTTAPPHPAHTRARAHALRRRPQLAADPVPAPTSPRPRPRPRRPVPAVPARGGPDLASAAPAPPCPDRAHPCRLRPRLGRARGGAAPSRPRRPEPASDAPASSRPGRARAGPPPPLLPDRARAIPGRSRPTSAPTVDRSTPPPRPLRTAPRR
ncbi:uncharacterized protein LOC110430379 [Sorghum bicolor]|uniref:uncharacterized protein LOC110430379 n=1 Tax=Sorghum bicolor TaxID=4558 RepID=UPI000B425468|nr:uncharacterized protein LOC110430379 [Sorghum bicolor]|eukprot:XP_021303711.1 uncharacterized protein LOC110430379 [Sorghum bicolor]